MTAKNVTPAPVRLEERHAKNGHQGAIIWLTGLSGSGKTTLSRALERRLFELGLQVYALDGDTLRLCEHLAGSLEALPEAALGHSAQGRDG